MAVSVAVVFDFVLFWVTINKCVREQKKKRMFDWLLKNDIIEGEINEHPLHAYISIEEEVESERLCEWCEREFSLCNTVASKNCISSYAL